MSASSPSTDRYTPLTALLVVLLCASFGVIWYRMPLMMDDLHHLSEILYSFTPENPFAVPESVEPIGNTLRGLVNCISVRAVYDNLRLTNMLGILFLTLPAWLVATFKAAVLLLLLDSLLRLAGIARSYLPGVSFMALCLVFLYPWHAGMFNHFYTFNYVVSGAIMMAAMVYFLRRERKLLWLSLLLGLLAGWSHESFGFSAIAVMAVALLCGHAPCRPRSLAMLGAAIAGFVIHFLCPGMYTRHMLFVKPPMLTILALITPLVAILVLIAVALLRGRFTLRTIPPSILLPMAGALAAAVPFMFSLCFRSATPIYLWLYIALWQLLPAWPGRCRRLLRPACMAAWAVMFVHLVLVVINTEVCRRQWNEFTELARALPPSQSTVCYDFSSARMLPFTLRRPIYQAEKIEFQLKALSLYLGRTTYINYTPCHAETTSE